MIPQINIFIVVDVIGALSEDCLAGNIFMVDNRPGRNTSGEGTSTLMTDVVNTQVLNWHVVPIDVQTSVEIEEVLFFKNGKRISEEGVPCAELRKYGAPSGDYWAGVVNVNAKVERGIYQYKIRFDMGRKTMLMDNFAYINVTPLS